MLDTDKYRGTLMRSKPVSTLSKIAMCTTALIMVATPVAAQTTGLDEIIVTARKRAENTQDVPIAISALNEKVLQESGFDGVEDLANMVPSLQFGTFGPTTFLNIRGIGSENTTGGSDPGVALHVDGVYVGRPVGALFSSFDTERVEVLRGPQGTLYGRNATGGSVNLISRKPTDEFEGEVDLTIGNYGRVRTRAAVNLPVSDTVQGRIVGFTENRDGFTENSVASGTDANDADNYGVRGHLNFDMNENASLLLSASYVSSGGAGSQAEQRDQFTTGVLFGPGPPPLRVIPFTNDLEPFQEGKDAPESQDNEFLLLSATLDWDFGNVAVKSITGYVESSYISTQDNDQSPAALQILDVEEDSKQFTQEIQLLSNTGSDFDWILGLFYFNEDVERFSTLYGPRFDAVRGFLTANVPGFNEEYAFRIGGDVEATSYAVFGQGTYNFTDALSATVGLRYTEDEKTGNNRNIFFAPQVVDAVALKSDAITGKASLDWKVNDSSLLYASYARGYKSGGVSQTTVAAGGRNPIFNPEFVDTYELGLKSRFADNRIQLNLAGYLSDYSDLQFQVFGDFGPEAGNAGAATIKGFEAELQAALSDTWKLDGSFAYTDATYDELITGPGAGNDFSGNRLPRTPEIGFNVGVTGDWNLSNGSNIRVRAEHAFTDEVFYEFRNGPESLASSYDNTNLRMFWTGKNDRLFAEAYVTNVFDTVQEGNILVGFSLGVAAGETGQEFITYNPPRQYGATIGYKF